MDPTKKPGLPRLRSSSGVTTTPAVASVTSNNGRIAGGTAVTIAGSFFALGAIVVFGGVPATGVTVVDAYTITCTTPVHAAGAVDVVVTNANGQQGTLAAGFTYKTSTVTSVDPPSGLAAGGTAVTLTGTDFLPASTISFGGVPATAVVYVSATTYTCVTPAGTAGLVVDVVMTEALGAVATLPTSYIYVSVLIPPGAPAPLLDQPTTPNTTAPTGSFLSSQAGIRWSPEVTIGAMLGNAPNVCTYTVDGRATPPLVNTDVSFVLGGILKFAGTITSIDATYEEMADGQHLVYHTTALDYTWQLNRFRPSGKYTRVLPSGIIRDMVGRFAPGYSIAYISSSIDANGPISITLSAEQDFATSLSQICNNATGDVHWKVDYYKNLRVFEGTDPTLPAVDTLVDGLDSLLNSPEIVLTTDLTQIRNLVRVVGKGTTSINNPLPLTGTTAGGSNWDIAGGAISYIPVADIAPFGDLFSDGGYLLAGGLQLRYLYARIGIQTGTTTVGNDDQTPNLVLDRGDPFTAANIHQLTLPTPYEFLPYSPGNFGVYFRWPDGLNIQPMSQVSNAQSISLYGVHEYFINDTTLPTYREALARATADVNRFAFPIKKLTYESTDTKSVPGARCPANMAYPMIHGDFVIQSVTLVHSEFDTRYKVVADSASRFEFNDLMLHLDDKKPSQVDVVGLVATAVEQAVAQIPVAGTSLTQASGDLTNAQVSAMNVTKITLITGIPGKIIVPLSIALYSQLVGVQSIGQLPIIRYKNVGAGTNIVVGGINWNTNTTAELLLITLNNFNGVRAAGPLGSDIEITANGAGGGGSSSNIFTWMITYYTVTPRY